MFKSYGDVEWGLCKKVNFAKGGSYNEESLGQTVERSQCCLGKKNSREVSRVIRQT